jgi:hypothetical protein
MPFPFLCVSRQPRFFYWPSPASLHRRESLDERTRGICHNLSIRREAAVRIFTIHGNELAQFDLGQHSCFFDPTKAFPVGRIGEVVWRCDDVGEIVRPVLNSKARLADSAARIRPAAAAQMPKAKNSKPTATSSRNDWIASQIYFRLVRSEIMACVAGSWRVWAIITSPPRRRGRDGDQPMVGISTRSLSLTIDGGCENHS